jgi:hypothetical protein
MRRASGIEMRPEAKTAVLIFSICFAYVLCAGGVLFVYIHAHPATPIPRFISVPILFLLILTITGVVFVTKRMAHKQAMVEIEEQGHLRRIRAIKGLKGGLVVWGLILLNDIRMLAMGSIPWKYAIPGLVVVVLMVAVCWMSLVRLKKIENAGSHSDQNHTP